MEFDYINKKYNTEYTNALFSHKHIFYEIYKECNFEFLQGCGSYLFDGKSYSYCDLMYEKQELLYNQVKTASKVLEIGTYMGHSLLIMLISNPNVKITCIDIDNKYTQPAVNILNKYFNNAITFIHKDSLSALQQIKDTFDFFHIDGHHENNYIENEFKLIEPLRDKSTIFRILFDDQNCLVKLQTDIDRKYTVIKKIIPKCNWNNIYYEISL